jgi:hypothetical protein
MHMYFIGQSDLVLMSSRVLYYIGHMLSNGLKEMSCFRTHIKLVERSRARKITSKTLALSTKKKHLLHMGWRTFFSSCAVVSFLVLARNRFWFYMLTYLEYNRRNCNEL